MTEQSIQPGKYVSLAYSISDHTGTVLEQNNIPIGYIFGGDSQLLGGMDEAIVGKTSGDEVEMVVEPAKGYGEHDPSLTVTDDLANAPERLRQVGAAVRLKDQTGEMRSFYVSRIENGKLTVDGNHPLAGKTLQVRVKILQVRDATEEDVRTSGIHATNLPALN